MSLPTAGSNQWHGPDFVHCHSESWVVVIESVVCSCQESWKDQAGSLTVWQQVHVDVVVVVIESVVCSCQESWKDQAGSLTVWQQVHVDVV
jgi:hypothetical protein